MLFFSLAMVFELLLAGFAVFQLLSNLRYLRTWATTSDVWVLTSQTCLVVAVLIWRGQTIGLQLIACAIALLGCLSVVFSTRQKPSRSEFLENILNTTVHPETRERTPFPADGSINYVPNFLLVVVYFANYLGSSNPAFNALSVAGLSALVPVFVIKLVKEKRL